MDLISRIARQYVSKVSCLKEVPGWAKAASPDHHHRYCLEQDAQVSARPTAKQTQIGWHRLLPVRPEGEVGNLRQNLRDFAVRRAGITVPNRKNPYAYAALLERDDLV
jgi:hypothetical protein